MPFGRARVAKLADALDLGSSAARRAGSTPASRIHTFVAVHGRARPHGWTASRGGAVVNFRQAVGLTTASTTSSRASSSPTFSPSPTVSPTVSRCPKVVSGIASSRAGATAGRVAADGSISEAAGGTAWPSAAGSGGSDSSSTPGTSARGGRAGVAASLFEA
jgi:hypothetical protein